MDAAAQTFSAPRCRLSPTDLNEVKEAQHRFLATEIGADFPELKRYHVAMADLYARRIPDRMAAQRMFMARHRERLRKGQLPIRTWGRA